MSVRSPADEQDWAQVDYVMTLTLFIMEKTRGTTSWSCWSVC